MRINYSIIFVGNMAESVAFYRDVFGIPLKFESPGWSEFLTDGATLALHKSSGPADDDNAQQSEQAGRCRPGFQVADLDEFHARMVAHKVSCTQLPTATFGVRIAQYIGPDGLVWAVSEAGSGE